jgi:hypothetical protein
MVACRELWRTSSISVPPEPSKGVPIKQVQSVNVVSSPEPVELAKVEVEVGGAPSVSFVMPVQEIQVVEERAGEVVEPAIDLPTVRVKWNAIIRAVDEKNHSLPFILKISQPHEVEGKTLIIRFQYPFHKDKIIADVKNRRIVEACAREILQVPSLVIEGIIGEDAARTEERSHDMVSNILKAFGGQVVEG